jgi:hypothetical protein
MNQREYWAAAVEAGVEFITAGQKVAAGGAGVRMKAAG